MTSDEVLAFQGHHLSVALADHARLDDAILEGVVEGRQVWLHLDGRRSSSPSGMSSRSGSRREWPGTITSRTAPACRATRGGTR